jgi:hypothetical protein
MDATATPLSHRDRAVLRAVASGRCEITDVRWKPGHCGSAPTWRCWPVPIGALLALFLRHGPAPTDRPTVILE